MNSQYKKNEKLIRYIIKKSVNTVDQNKDITTIILYCNKKVKT